MRREGVSRGRGGLFMAEHPLQALLEGGPSLGVARGSEDGQGEWRGEHVRNSASTRPVLTALTAARPYSTQYRGLGLGQVYKVQVRVRVDRMSEV